MRLKKIELFGFKSFADKTVVEFDQGVTCIVGPNGCGKSNISDAMRWVLGERSAKLLRGTKMEDVIFAGTEFRKPVAMAEVQLTIDNEDRGLPIDYNEVAIGRRLYRSGESEYTINRTVCRLKDIQDLILDTGIGSNSYSMIEQGRIDHILNADADERRFLIEEAAGISKYKVKKEEAIRKLGRTEDNLLRLKDIVKEVQRNIQYAERQARRAERFKEQFEKLKDLEIRKAFHDLDMLHDEKSRLEKIQAERQSNVGSLESKLRECRELHAKQQEVQKEVLDRFSAEEMKRYELRSKIEHNDQELKFHQEKRVEFATRKGEIAQEREQLQDRVEKARDEIVSKESEIGDLENEKGGAYAELQSSEGELSAVDQRLEESRQSMNASKNESLDAARNLDECRNEYHRLCALLESSKEQKMKQEAGISRFRQEMDSWEARKGSCEQELTELNQRMQELEGQKEHLRGEGQRLKEQIAGLELKIRGLEDKSGEKQTRVGVLREIDAGSAVDPRELLAEAGQQSGYLLHDLRELIHVDSGYELALEAALGDFSRAMIAEDEKVVQDLWGRIRDRNTTAFGLIVAGNAPLQQRKFPPFNEMKPDHPDVLKSLRQVVRIREGFEGLFESFLDQTFLVNEINQDNLYDLWKISQNYRLISLQGTVMGPGGRVFFREGNLADEQSFFKRGAEIEQLQHELDDLAAETVSLQAEMEGLKQAYQRNLEAMGQADDVLTETKIQVRSLDSAIEGSQDRLGSFQRELDLIFTESQETESREQVALQKKMELESQMADLDERERSIRAQQELLARDLERIERERSDMLTRVAERRARYDSLADRERLLRESFEMIRHHDRLNRERLEQLAEELSRIEKREEELVEIDDRITQEQVEFHELARVCDLQIETIRQEKDAADQELTMLEESLRQLQESLQDLQSMIHREEMSAMDVGYQEKAIHDRMLQSYKLDLNDFVREEYPWDVVAEDNVEEIIEQLRKKVESIGTVNMLAIEEYEELKERYDFLMTQQQDLDDARASLLEAIRKINRTTKQLFEDTFNSVQLAFKEYYQTLFRGGDAKLVLIDESNPLDSGVDIIVRPPGKKLQHISLLSGGEKAMTALALLFSLFKIKPSPFCVLDEVDAPLDEANIDRFLHVLRGFLASSQFIIVTHSRKTIAMGDTLYGVTMQDAGVSKIVSVKVNPDEGVEGKDKVETHVTA